MIYTGDEADLDGMAIAQLNGLQLERLQTASADMVTSSQARLRVTVADTPAAAVAAEDETGGEADT